MTNHSIEIVPATELETVYTLALTEALDLLKQRWEDPQTGIVAAALVENNQVVAKATSLFIPEQGKWLHAEAATLAVYTDRFGRLPRPDAAMVATLSPCTGQLSSRIGESCSELLRSVGIRQLRYGCLDEMQVRHQYTYANMGFDAQLIKDPELRQTCSLLYGLFEQLSGPDGRYNHLPYGNGNPWPRIKQDMGSSIFGTR